MGKAPLPCCLHIISSLSLLLSLFLPRRVRQVRSGQMSASRPTFPSDRHLTRPPFIHSCFSSMFFSPLSPPQTSTPHLSLLKLSPLQSPIPPQEWKHPLPPPAPLPHRVFTTQRPFEGGLPPRAAGPQGAEECSDRNHSLSLTEGEHPQSSAHSPSTSMHHRTGAV